MKKLRADLLLVELGLAESRAIAQRLIMAGEVRLGPDDLVRKPGQMLPEDAPVSVPDTDRYVSRGAHKLLCGIEEFSPELEGVVALDVGASTGGFTDVLLRHGAAKVYAVDVGYGQLHLRLRQDPRVVCLERTNARALGPELIPDPIDVLVGDVSFISLRKVLPPCAPLLRPEAWVLVLVKPQFEAGRSEVGKGGVIRDPAVRQRCVDEIRDFGAHSLGWTPQGVVPSPIKGPKGNQEFILVFRTPAGMHHSEAKP
ncbi:MAG: TlyA family RNA methyltransferase [Victivallales bacterium]|jgi:23S rRNA (cytidine1920-2'-O)/16S rRNA (cytidine1409-2'-O)-methyltransferase|nr:TlyA family RNA methyltransferase [Victivallales bacterium]